MLFKAAFETFTGNGSRTQSRLASFVLGNSLLLLAGTVAAVAWANIDLTSYEHVAHPLHFWVNDVGMMLSFPLAAKEVFEATLPGGALASPRRALSPLAAAVGGMAVPGTMSSWPGLLSWAALYLGGFHPALALVPVVPFMPHSSRDLGLFDPPEARRRDTLNQFEHWWATPVQSVLLLFGFANAGVPFAQTGPGTSYVLTALLLGKPVGVLLFCAGAHLVGARLPAGLRDRDLLLVGMPLRSALPCPSFSQRRHFRKEPHWPKPRWERS